MTLGRAVAAACAIALSSVMAQACENPDAIGTARTVVIDTAEGRHFGSFNGYESANTLLREGEVVLTFDDGPNPRATGRVLDTLAEHCAKATFFVVGQMARWHPELLRRTAAAGHTIAGHTRTHPMPFGRTPFAEGAAEIEAGFRDVETVIGEPATAFFRFPGLSDRPDYLEYLSDRGISVLSVDVISGDTDRDATSQSVVRTVMARLKRRGRGILLFHDPLKRTARALPILLDALQAEGYRIVHFEGTGRYSPDGGAALVARATPSAAQDANTSQDASAEATRRAVDVAVAVVDALIADIDAAYAASLSVAASDLAATDLAATDLAAPAVASARSAPRRPERVEIEAPVVAALY